MKVVSKLGVDAVGSKVKVVKADESAVYEYKGSKQGYM